MGYEWMEIGMGRSGGVWFMVSCWWRRKHPATGGPASDMRSLIDKVRVPVLSRTPVRLCRFVMPIRLVGRLSNADA